LTKNITVVLPPPGVKPSFPYRSYTFLLFAEGEQSKS